MDDLMIASDTKPNHFPHLSQLFQRLNTYNVRINSDKCIFGQSSFEFLGHYIDSNSIQPLPSNVDTIQCISPPASSRQLCHFLGIVILYRGFTTNCTDDLLLMWGTWTNVIRPFVHLRPVCNHETKETQHE